MLIRVVAVWTERQQVHRVVAVRVVLIDMVKFGPICTADGTAMPVLLQDCFPNLRRNIDSPAADSIHIVSAPFPVSFPALPAHQGDGSQVRVTPADE
jgi:hypothetical protein